MKTLQKKIKFKNSGDKTKGVLSTLDLTPVVDIVFNLLIFFALSLNFAATSGGINLKLPTASSSDPIKSEEITINLTSDGGVYLNDKSSSLNEIRTRLHDTPDKSSLVIIRADGSVQHSRVVEAMDLVKSEGFSRLAIAVERKNSTDN